MGRRGRRVGRWVAEILPTLPHVKGCLRLARAPLRRFPARRIGARSLRPESARGRDGRRPRPRSGHLSGPTFDHVHVRHHGAIERRASAALARTRRRPPAGQAIRISQRRCNLCLSTAIPRQRLSIIPAIQRFGRTPRWRFPSGFSVSQFWNDIRRSRRNSNSMRWAGWISMLLKQSPSSQDKAHSGPPMHGSALCRARPIELSNRGSASRSRRFTP